MGGEGCRRLLIQVTRAWKLTKWETRQKHWFFQKKQFGINCGTTVENIYFALPDVTQWICLYNPLKEFSGFSTAGKQQSHYIPLIMQVWIDNQIQSPIPVNITHPEQSCIDFSVIFPENVSVVPVMIDKGKFITMINSAFKLINFPWQPDNPWLTIIFHFSI